jgi:hypothetical protein
LKMGLGNSTPQSLITQFMCMFSSTFSTFSKWRCEPSTLLTGWIIQELREWKAGGENSVMMVRVPTRPNPTVSPCSQVLLKQSRLCCYRGTSAYGMWTTHLTRNWLYSGECWKIWAPLCRYLGHVEFYAMNMCSAHTAITDI